MNNYSLRYKLVSSFFLIFVLTISTMFAFLIAPKAVDGNVAYWIFKGLALASIVGELVFLFTKNASFHKYFPVSIALILYQGVPALMRIGYVKDKTAVPVGFIFLGVILTFMILGVVMLYALSSDQFKEAEQKAKHSSNYKGKR